MKGIIYMYTSPNGKKYVGQTWDEQKRKSDHKIIAKKSVFHSAIKKYGFNKFKYEILHSNIRTQKELDRLEILEIQKNNSIAPNGYNIALGGYGGKLCESAKQKIKERWEDESFREKTISCMKKAANKPERIKQLTANAVSNGKNKELLIRKGASLRKTFASEESRKKRSINRKKEWSDPEIRKKRIDGINLAYKNEDLRKKISETSKEHWKNPEYRAKISASLKGKKRPQSAIDITAEKRSKAIQCVETGVIYKSSTHASIILGISRTGIVSALTGKQQTAGNYHWKYKK